MHESAGRQFRKTREEDSVYECTSTLRPYSIKAVLGSYPDVPMLTSPEVCTARSLHSAVMGLIKKHGLKVSTTGVRAARRACDYRWAIALRDLLARIGKLLFAAAKKREARGVFTEAVYYETLGERDHLTNCVAHLILRLGPAAPCPDDDVSTESE